VHDVLASRFIVQGRYVVHPPRPPSPPTLTGSTSAPDTGGRFSTTRVQPHPARNKHERNENVEGNDVGAGLAWPDGLELIYDFIGNLKAHRIAAAEAEPTNLFSDTGHAEFSR